MPLLNNLTTKNSNRMNIDVIIVGGGLSGLTAAIHLSKSGLKVLIIEKQSFPRHKVCGEYLSQEVLPYLDWLGLDLFQKNPAIIKRVEVSTIRGNLIKSKLEQGGIGISRFTLDTFMLEKAITNGCILMQDTVLSINQLELSARVLTEKHGLIRARKVLAAYGKRSNLDISQNRPFLRKDSSWLGIKAHYRGNFPTDLVALHHFRGGYCGVSKVENSIINICYLTTYESFKKAKNIDAFQTQVMSENPFLRKLFNSCEAIFQPISIGQVSFAGKNSTESDLLMLGDTAGLIHPFCGNGMAIAIHSAKLAAELVIENLAEGNLNSELSRKYSRLWNREFKKRIDRSKVWAALIGNESASEILLGALTLLPFMLPLIIKQTHGNLLTIPISC